MNSTFKFYQQNADSLIKQYDSVSFEMVHRNWLMHIPLTGCALDIGAGSGRDARYLADKGLEVYAAEPASSLFAAAKNSSKNQRIIWFQDKLPRLNKAQAFNKCFDLILLSAVWMHLSPKERIVSMQNMSSLLQQNGKLVITLRHGAFDDGRLSYLPCAKELGRLAHEFGLALLLETGIHEDQLGRNEVAWKTVVFIKG